MRCGEVPTASGDLGKSAVFVDRNQLENLELAAAGRSLNRDNVTDLLTDQASSDGRRGGNSTVGDVSFLAGHDLVFDVCPFGDVADHDCGAEADAVVRDVVEVDQRNVREAFAELREARVDIALPLFRRMVLCVLAQVAVRASRFQLSGELMV
jgi:hypothetical protein